MILIGEKSVATQGDGLVGEKSVATQGDGLNSILEIDMV